MSNRLTFSLASLIVLIALGLVFVATPANAASFADDAEITGTGADDGDISVVQGQKIDITFPTATATELAGADPSTDPAGTMSAQLTPTGLSAVDPSTADPPAAETSGTLQGLTFTFDAETGVGKLTGNANPNTVTRILVTYTVSETDGGADADTDPADPVSLVFAFEVTAQTDLLEFPADADIDDKELTVGSYFHEVLPAAQDGIGPLTYSIAGVTTETPADSGIFTGGDLPAGLTFVPATRVLSGTPNAQDDRAVLTYTVTDATPTTPVVQTISFTIEVAARVNGPMFAIAKVSDAAYTKGHAIKAMTLPAADITNALGSVTYKLEPLPKGLSFDATSRMLTGTPNPDAAGDTAAMYTATDTAGNAAMVPFKITVNDKVSVTITNPNPDTYMRGASGFQTITVAAANGTGDKTLMVTGLPVGLMFDAMKGEITGTPTMAAATEITASAEDSLGATGEAKATITVAAAPALVFTSVVAPQSYEVGTPITPMLLPEGSGGIAPYTYALSGLPAGITFDPTTRLLRGTPTAAAAAADYDYVISDSAFSHIESPTADQTPNSITLPISITVMEEPASVNSAPDFGDATIANITATVGVAIPGMFLPEATDADGDTLTYSVTPALPDGITFSATNRALTGTPTAMMSETAYTYMVDDSNGGTDTIGFFITVNAASTVNAAPAFASNDTVDNIVATAGMAIEGRFLPSATDPEGDPVNYWITPPLPTGLVFNRDTRALTGTPATAMSQTAYTYNAADASNLLSPATLPFFITVNEAPNVAPVYADTTPVAIMGTAGVAITPVSVAATDANGDTLTYSWDVNETALGLMLNTSTGMISGTPLKAHTGSHPVTATDPDGLYAMRDVTVTIAAAPETNVAPVVTITTTLPETPPTGSFVIAYTAMDANASDTVTVTAAHTMSPASATGYTVAHDDTAKMVTITQAPGSPIAVIEVTISASDGSLSHSQSISVTFAASAPTPVDTTPPTVQVTAPIAPDADGNLVFTFVFSEPIRASSFTAMDIAGEDYIVTAGPTMDATDTMMKTWTATVKATGDDDVTVVINVGAVMDMAGNANVAGAFGKYTPPTAPAAPVVTATPAVGSVTFTWTAVAGSTYQYNTDGTTWMDATAGSVTVSGSTEITFRVRVKAAGGVPAGTTATVKATPTAPPPSTDGIFTIPAKSYIIVGHAGRTEGLPQGITAMPWPSMPNLDALLRGGGTVLLTTPKATLLDRDNNADTAAEAAKKRDALITEVMAAVNTATIGQASYTAHQWIELYNNLPVPITVKLSSKSGRPASDASATEVRLDRLSNQVGAGWAFDGLGQNGFDDGQPTTTDVDFISFYRSARAGDKDGHVKGHWKTSSELYLGGHKGTPGRGEPVGAKTFAKSGVRMDVVINEVSNHDNPDYEWIELMVREGKPIHNFENWQMSIVTGVGKDDEIFTLPKLDTGRLSGRHLLVTDSDPATDGNHPLAAGYNVLKSDADNAGEGRDKNIRYIVRNFKKELPDDGNFVLILRHGNDKRGSKDKVEDVAGRSTTSLAKNDASTFTNLWPLVNHGAPNLDNNKLNIGVHYRQHADTIGTGTKDGNKVDKTAFRDAGWTGIGYKRFAAGDTSANKGTPGYPNNVVQRHQQVVRDSVVISEIMFDRDVRDRAPQWIELYNTSATVGVSLQNWKLTITNHDQDGNEELFAGEILKEYKLPAENIPPKQSYLIAAFPSRVSSSQPNARTHFPDTRVHALTNSRGTVIINSYGFELKLEAWEKDNVYHEVDTVGNLGPAPAAGEHVRQQRRSPRSFVDPAWAWPENMDVNRYRVSLVRLLGMGTPVVGTREDAWVRFDMAQDFAIRGRDRTFYGDTNDLSSPGHTVGGALPVSLSKFRPERLDDGSIQIVWVTESELNNAGFNILRSEKRDGEFKQINTKLIAGQGTASERTAYEFTDTSAKPNVVYYYQIQDVSFDGEVTTLRTTHLRGNVTPAGKITTTWGELKALQ